MKRYMHCLVCILAIVMLLSGCVTQRYIQRNDEDFQTRLNLIATEMAFIDKSYRNPSTGEFSEEGKEKMNQLHGEFEKWKEDHQNFEKSTQGKLVVGDVTMTMGWPGGHSSNDYVTKQDLWFMQQQIENRINQLR
ncbi:MAG: hypothetical protein V2A69_11455 [Pseudomonadota bacterium]